MSDKRGGIALVVGGDLGRTEGGGSLVGWQQRRWPAPLSSLPWGRRPTGALDDAVLDVRRRPPRLRVGMHCDRVRVARPQTQRPGAEEGSGSRPTNRRL